jgi:hypothetical protein
MKIVTFCQIDESLFSGDFTVEHFHSGTSGDADIVVIDINSIFEFEENKGEVCKEKFVSISLVEDDSDYDAFKNFGIDAWIKASDVNQINGIINLVDKRLLS